MVAIELDEFGEEGKDESEGYLVVSMSARVEVHGRT